MATPRLSLGSAFRGTKARLFGDADGSPDIDARDFLVVA
jgi:hypothetical protein